MAALIDVTGGGMMGFGKPGRAEEGEGGGGEGKDDGATGK
jgi:hypothetical protein